MADSPNIQNYYIGKGIVSFKKDGEVDFVDCGNVPVFEFTPSIDKLEHFSSRGGTKTKDRTVVLAKSGQIKMTMEEYNARNMAISLLGEVDTNSEDQQVIDIFSSNAVSGQLKFTGTNEVGPKWELIFNKVDFIPGSSVSFLTDEWGSLEINGDVAAVAGSFGTATLIEEESE